MRLVAWHTPFSQLSCPSISIAPSREQANAVDVHVGSAGYVDRFARGVSHRSTYEGMEPDSLPPFQAEGSRCSFLVKGSPWKADFAGHRGLIEASFGLPFEELQHYVLAGGDHTFEALSWQAVIALTETPPSASEGEK